MLAEHPANHVGALARERQPVPHRVVRCLSLRQVDLGLRLARMDEVDKLDAVLFKSSRVSDSPLTLVERKDSPG